MSAGGCEGGHAKEGSEPRFTAFISCNSPEALLPGRFLLVLSARLVLLFWFSVRKLTTMPRLTLMLRAALGLVLVALLRLVLLFFLASGCPSMITSTS
jgi:hypothetical protein